MSSSQRRGKKKGKKENMVSSPASTTQDLDDHVSATTQSARERMAAAHGRRRSSLSAIEALANSKLNKNDNKMTAFERAKQQRLLEQQRKAEEEEKKLEKKRELAKKNKAAMKAKDHKNRTKKSPLYNEVKDDKNFVQCSFCHELISNKTQATSMIEEHTVKHPTMIRQRLWLGDGFNACDINVIKACKITHILNCTREIALPKAISKLLSGFKRLPLVDKTSENILASLKEGLEFVDNALYESKNNIVFIHCRQGISRSVSLVCSYLMWKEGLSFHSALSDVRSKRPIAMPNTKFTKQLNEFEKILAIKLKNNDNNNNNNNDNSSEMKYDNDIKEDAVFLDGLGYGHKFKLEKFNQAAYSGACNSHIELLKKSQGHSGMNDHTTMERVRSNSVDRASVVDRSQLAAFAAMYKNEEEEKYNDENKQATAMQIDKIDTTVSSQENGKNEKNDKNGNNRNKNKNDKTSERSGLGISSSARSNKSRKSKSPQHQRGKAKDAKKGKNIKNKNDNKNDKNNGDGSVSVSNKRRNSASIVETPKSPSNKFDFDFRIDNDLLKRASIIKETKNKPKKIDKKNKK